MNVEQIKAILDARAASRAMEEEARNAVKRWDSENLTPLLKECDHRYPWGESAIKDDHFYRSGTCQICGKSFNR